MTVRVRSITMPSNQADYDTALQENLRRGWAPVPGVSDHELGTRFRTEGDQPLYVPHLHLPPWDGHRTGVTGWFVAGIFVFVAGLAGAVAAVLP